MPKKPTTQKQLLLELENLRARLDEAEDTLRAIRSGEVGALIVSNVGGEQLFTLKGADHSYRILIEDMAEGALTLTDEGLILYANRCFAEMLKTPLEKVISSAIHTWIAPADQKIFQALLRREDTQTRRSGEVTLLASDGTLVPGYLSINVLQIEEMQGLLCMVATDLTVQKRTEAIAASENLAQELLAASNQSRLALLSVIEDQKQAEDQLKVSLTKYQVLFDSFPLGITISDKAGNIKESNKAAEFLLGLPADEQNKRQIDGKEWRIIRKDGSPMPADEYASIRALKENRLVENVEMGIVKGPDDITWINVTAAPISLEDYGVAIAYGDITKRKRAQEKLRESEARYRVLFETASEGILIADIQMKEFRYVNPAMCNMLGYSEKEMLKMGVADIHPQKKLEYVISEFEAQAREGKTLASNIPCLRKDGEILYVNISTTKAMIDGRECNIGFFTDITERKQAEEELKLFRKLIDQSNDAVEVINPKTGRFIDVNEKGCMDLGYSREEFLSLSVFDIDPNVDQSLFKGSMEEIKKSGAFLLESIHQRKDGSTFPVEINMKYVHLEQDYAIIIARDITARKQAEYERQRLINVIEQTDNLIIIMDKNGIIQYVNPAFEVITGYTTDEAIGKTLQFFAGTDNSVLFKGIWDKLNNGIKWSGRLHAKRKDGGNYILDSSISPILDESETITSYTAVMRDVTSIFLQEQRLRESQKMEAIGTLAGGIAHDFNNILAGIIGYAELSLDTVPEGSQLHSDLTKIFKAGYRARDLVNQILTFSRQREQEKRPIQITPILNESLKLLRASLPTSIEIQQNIEPEIGTVLADTTQIHQIIMNLCTNAGHAMSEKGGILEVSLCNVEVDEDFTFRHPGLSPGPHLKLTVSDTGSGIEPDVIKRIFDPYFTTKEKSGGTGLGLAVIHGIVNSYNGIITVYSEPGKGTTFKVYLSTTTEEAVAEIKKTRTVTKGHERILLIDDDQNIIDIGKRRLEQLGYTVTTNSSSMDALEIFQKDPYQFDLVITDMTMPFMTGDELAGEFMRIRQDIPVVICTGYSEKLTEEKALSIGLRAYLGKPLFKSEIAETVRRVLDQKSEDI